MKLNRSGVAVSLLAAGALLLAGCGSDNNAPTAGGARGGSSAASRRSMRRQDDLKSSGSTAQANAMTRFVAAYESRLLGPDPELHLERLRCRGRVSSSASRPTSVAPTPRSTRRQGEVDKAATRCGSPAWNLPVVFGPIAVTYNLPGVDGLVLDGPTAAKIFNGGITEWNDPAIAALNPGKTLPATKITVVYRNDQSGTTDNFQKYLDAASDGAWGKGAGKTFNGGVGEGAKGNEGTSAAIKSTTGSITYNEWSFAKAQNLTMAGDRHLGRTGSGRRSAPNRWVRRSRAPRSRAAATTWCWTPRRSTSRPSRARTRSCWPPTRSSARSTPTPTPARR